MKIHALSRSNSRDSSVSCLGLNFAQTSHSAPEVEVEGQRLPRNLSRIPVLEPGQRLRLRGESESDVPSFWGLNCGRQFAAPSPEFSLTHPGHRAH